MEWRRKVQNENLMHSPTKYILSTTRSFRYIFLLRSHAKEARIYVFTQHGNYEEDYFFLWDDEWRVKVAQRRSPRLATTQSEASSRIPVFRTDKSFIRSIMFFAFFLGINVLRSFESEFFLHLKFSSYNLTFVKKSCFLFFLVPWLSCFNWLCQLSVIYLVDLCLDSSQISIK